jgi:RNA polymerase sigma factor (sigma-70 family)
MVVSTEPPAADADRLLRDRIRRGDHDAFVEVYRAHAGAVLRLAHRLTGSATTAEDVASETFLVAWRNRGGLLADDRSVRPWLLAITTKQSLNATRSLRRRLAFLARRTEPMVVADFADESADRLDDARRLREAAAALAHLTRAEAEVVGLCVWSGLTYAEAAQALEIPVGTVRSRLARARARLRDHTGRAGSARHPAPSPTTEGSR